jgi:hypothetical protein
VALRSAMSGQGVFPVFFRSCPSRISTIPHFPPGQHTNRLAHWPRRERTDSMSFRLEDSVPMAKLRQQVEARRIGAERQGPRPWTTEDGREYHIRFFGKVERRLDLGSVSWVLREPRRGPRPAHLWRLGSATPFAPQLREAAEET